MKCPHCGSDQKLRVVKTNRPGDGTVVRKRRCPACRHDFETTEKLSDAGLKVRKSDGSVEEFDRAKLRKSLRKGTVREYSDQRLDELVDLVQVDVFPLSAQGPIPSSSIGGAVLAHLKEVDQSSHIRFALAYAGGWNELNEKVVWTDISKARRWLQEQYPEAASFPPVPGSTQVVKHDGRRVPFDRSKLERSIGYASKGRGARGEVHDLANKVADQVERNLNGQPIVTSGQIASEVMRDLLAKDHIAYLRYASTVKHFTTPRDFLTEIERLFHRRRPEA